MAELKSKKGISQGYHCKCRFCDTELNHTFIDLGMSPLCQTHIKANELNKMEPFYPLHVYVCDNCFLVQLDEFVAPGDIFSDYAYFSSYSDSWVQHAKEYVEMISDRLSLNRQSLIIEIASNDGYLLQHFVKKGIPALGIEPAANIAEEAKRKGIETIVQFFGEETAKTIGQTHGKVDLLIGNNVLAHVPNLNDFVKGLKTILKPNGVITMEFPHLYRLMERNQFDTIYHEHFSYLSFLTVERVFASHGISLFDVEELETHGGSLRLFGCHTGNNNYQIGQKVYDLREFEVLKGLDKLETYTNFTEKVKKTKRNILDFLSNAKNHNRTIVGYGAPGKGNTLLNYCGIRQDFLDYTVDRSPHKQGKFTPGTRIPIYHPDKIKETKPDYIFILPWNLKDEIIEQMSFARDWGGKFVVPIPEIEIIE